MEGGENMLLVFAKLPTFVSDIISFFQTALTWITALAIPAVALTATWHALMRSSAQDEHDAARHAKSFRSTLKYGVIAILAGAIVSSVLGFFI
jgi:hypothetical protein